MHACRQAGWPCTPHRREHGVGLANRRCPAERGPTAELLGALAVDSLLRRRQTRPVVQQLNLASTLLPWPSCPCLGPARSQQQHHHRQQQQQQTQSQEGGILAAQLQFLYIANSSDPRLSNVSVVVEVDGVPSRRSATVIPDPSLNPVSDSCTTVLWSSLVRRLSLLTTPLTPDVSSVALHLACFET